MYKRIINRGKNKQIFIFHQNYTIRRIRLYCSYIFEIQFRPNPLGSRNKLYEQWRGGRALRFMKRTRETRRGIRLSVIAAKLRPIDKVKNLRWIYDVGRGG